jgi:hypothetical protein|tara:strand:- start:367 stop:1383 length:1017 start_codon:yes stop_codon:yes gene_type:complete
MDVANTVKTNLIDPIRETLDMAIPATKEMTTTKGGLMLSAEAVGGFILAFLVGRGINAIPFNIAGQMIGRAARTVVTFGLGAGILKYSMGKDSVAGITAGAVFVTAGVLQALSYTGRFKALDNMVNEGKSFSAESGYYGDMNLSNYEAIDSVEVDRSSYQPTQDYGAETIEQEMTENTPQVEIAQEMVGNNLDSVRQEAAMGHGVTQWFGAEYMNSATSPHRKMDMKRFKASTDVGGNRASTGDNSMANVIGGTSMADSAPSMTAYDVNMEAGIIPTTKELGGGMQDVFDTYILPSYEMPSAAGSGHGVTQWYAESNQTGFIGNFVAGAEGHGSVLGQ